MDAKYLRKKGKVIANLTTGNVSGAYTQDAVDKGTATDIPLIGGIFSSGKKDQAKADASLAQLEALYGNMKAPEQTDVSYQNQEWLKDLSPEQISTIMQGDSAMGGISTDPRLKQDQQASLQALRDIAASGGMNATDTANLSKLNSDVGTADKGRRDAIMQGMHQRGQGGSGLDLMAQLQSSQAATDRQAQGSLDVAGMAQDRALRAIQQGGQMAGNMQQQDFGQQAQIAQARDAINRFNTGNMNQNNQFNAQQAQQTNVFNANGRQDVANNNVGTANRATEQNHGNAQRDFGNRMDIAAGQSGALKTGMGYHEGQAAQKEQAKRDAWGNVVKVGAAAYTGGASAAAPTAVAATDRNTAPNQSTLKQKPWWEE